MHEANDSPKTAETLPAHQPIQPDPAKGEGTRAVTGLLRSTAFLLLAVLSTVVGLLTVVLILENFKYLSPYGVRSFNISTLLDGSFYFLAASVPIILLILVPVGLWLLYGHARRSGRIHAGALTLVKVALKVPLIVFLVCFGWAVALFGYALLTDGLFSLALHMPGLFQGLERRFILQVLVMILVVILWFVGVFRTIRALRFTIRTGRSAERISLMGAILSLLLGGNWLAYLIREVLERDSWGMTGWDRIRRFPESDGMYALLLLFLCLTLIWYGILSLRCRALMRRAVLAEQTEET